MSSTVSRRSFLGGITAAVGCLTAEAPLGAQAPAVVRQPRPRLGLEEYDAAAKLAYNENPVRAIRSRDEGDEHRLQVRQPLRLSRRRVLSSELATHHGIKPDNLLLGAGSG